MSRWIAGAALCLLAGACQDNPLAPLGLEEDILTDAALGRTIERDTDAPLQTDSLVYHLEGGGEWRSVTIPFRYRNDTGETISIVNCNGGLNIGLEKRVGDEWTHFYSPVLLGCLSPPITIAPDETVEYTAGIFGALPNRNLGPEFESADLDGEYRLVWGSLVHDYDDDKQGFGDDVGPLRSNSFLLVESSND